MQTQAQVPTTMDYSFFALNSVICLQCTIEFLIYLFKGVMKGRIRAISRHREGQESSESNPCQGKLQKDLDFVHIPMYAVLVVKPVYIRAYKFKSRVYHFSHVFRDGLGNIKGKNGPRGLRSMQRDRGRPYKCDSPRVVKSAITDAP